MNASFSHITRTMFQAILFFVILTMFVACQDDTPAGPPIDPQDSVDVPHDSIRVYDKPDTLCVVIDDRVDELSGIAASRLVSFAFWLHNDSGDKARLFAVDSSGNTLAVCTLQNSTHVDWEDMASVTLQGTAWLYVGDIGDNSAKRDSIAIHRISEPALNPVWRDHALSVNAETAWFIYEDGPRDCEALMVDPRDGSILLLEKTNSLDAGVYRAPWPGDGGNGVFKRIASVSLPYSIGLLRNITGSDMTPDGSRIIVRSYGGLIEYIASAADSPATILTGDSSITLPAGPLLQPEAVCYTRDGLSIVTSTEGSQPPLLRFLGH